MKLTRLLTSSLIGVSVTAAILSVEALAYEGGINTKAVDSSEDYSPFVGRDYPDQVLFGDLHFHTEISFDAGLIGTSLTMHEAFRVARGEKITSNTGQPVQLIRPLDFLAITEHAEMLGLATAMLRGSQETDPAGK